MVMREAISDQEHEAVPPVFLEADEIDFREQILEHVPSLRRHARALTRDAEAADDLVHDALLRAIEKNHMWERGTNLKAWLHRILHNHFINTQRRNKLRPSGISPDDYDIYMDSAATQMSHMELKSLEDALHMLPAAQRDVLLLIGVEGLSYDEAAQILNCPTGTVRSRLSRARDGLRRLMGGDAA
jgi:RNA polymerase sigma-70 factor (ECF subfamily)